MKISFGSYFQIVGHRPGQPAKKSTADAPLPDRTGQSLPMRARLSVANWLPLKIQRQKIPQSREKQQASLTAETMRLSPSEKEKRALQEEERALQEEERALQEEEERALQEAIAYIRRGATFDASKRGARLASRTQEAPAHQDDTTGAQMDERAQLATAKNKGKEQMVGASSGSSFHQQLKPISVRNDGEASTSRVPHRASTAGRHFTLSMEIPDQSLQVPKAEGPGLPQALPEGGWDMVFLRKAAQSALQDMAWDNDFASSALKRILSSPFPLDLEATDKTGLTPLLAAALSHNIDCIKILIEHGANVDASDSKGDTALHMLAGSDAQMLKQLLDAGADPGIANWFGETPLFHARSAVAVEHLLDYGSPINHCDLDGNSAVMRMVLSKRFDVMLALLGRRAALGIKNKSGLSFSDLLDEESLQVGRDMVSLRKAEQRVLEELQDMAWNNDFASSELKRILSSHPDLEARNETGLTPLLAAALSHNIAFIKILIEHGANVDASDSNGDTALHMLASSDAQMLKQLLDAGADPGIANWFGETPLFHARSAVAVEHLLDYGSPINHCDLDGNSAVMRMVLLKRSAVMLALLGRGADLDIKNKSGLSFANLLNEAGGNIPLDAISNDPLRAKAFIELMYRESKLHFFTLEELEDRKPVPPSIASPAIHGRAPEVRSPSNRQLSGQKINIVDRPDHTFEVRRPINRLPSGQKINLVNHPDHTFHHLDASDAEAISEALGFGKLPKHSEEMAQQLTAIRESFALFASELCNDLKNYDNEILSVRELFAPLSDAEFDELLKVIDTTHMKIAAKQGMDGDFEIPLQLRVFFYGTQNLSDLHQDIRNAFGMIGNVDRAAKRAGELFAKLLAHSGGDGARLDFLSGGSMGGASAQTFLATIESCIQLPNQPLMMLLDPQLLNNRQARRATKGGSLDVNYSKPRGVAITLDYDKKPHRGLMGIMKGAGGYRYPGLVQIKLGLTDTDGENDGRPKTSGPPGFGYHSEVSQFARALGRFSENRLQEILDDPALKDMRPLRWIKPEKPVHISDTLIPYAKRRRFPMHKIDEEDGGSEE